MAETTDKAWFLYVVPGANGSLYIEISNDVPRRCKRALLQNGTFNASHRKRMKGRLAVKESATWSRNPLRRMSCSFSSSTPMKSVRLRSSIHG